MHEKAGAPGMAVQTGYIASMTTTRRNQDSLISLILRRGREERLAQTAGGLTFTMVVSMVWWSNLKRHNDRFFQT
jgi:hypothetical protein